MFVLSYAVATWQSKLTNYSNTEVATIKRQQKYCFIVLCCFFIVDPSVVNFGGLAKRFCFGRDFRLLRTLGLKTEHRTHDPRVYDST